MRLSKLFFRTFKEAPAEADTISHRLLERGGYLKKLGKGLYIYTPLMWKVLQKVMNIIREELNAFGCQEISMPMLHPSELWKQTGRWHDFTSADLLYTLKDREGHEYCMGPTNEEIVVYLASNWMTSYKQVPFNLYQIGNKFRDEIRPRFGLVRCKEFIMKDGYSFCANPEQMEEQYQNMRTAYSNIFTRCGLDFVIVEADGGKIGKGKSEEFQVKADIGEDFVMFCGPYAANVEAAVAIPPAYEYSKELKEKERISTPRISTIEDLSKSTQIPHHQILKTVIYKLFFADDISYVAIGIRGDREVNTVKVSSFFKALEIELASEEEIKKATGCPVGFAGPIQCKIPFYCDLTGKPMTNFLCAANEVDVHYKNVNWERDCSIPEFHDFLQAQAGDGCPHVPGGVYQIQKGIEVGHIFNLGTRYTQQLSALFQDEHGHARPFWMGTYGIGVGRLTAACIEQRHDEKGIMWPLALAPFRVTITAATLQNAEHVALAEKIYDELQRLGYEPLLDDREERVGFKLKDSDLLGIPFKIIVGKAYEKDKKLEIENRAGEKSLISVDEILNWAEEHLKI